MTVLERSVFAAWFTLLCERFNREPSAAMTGAYYRLVAERLDTAEFERNAARLLASARFFPAPAEFWESEGSVSAEDEAALAWARLMAFLRENKSGPLPLESAAARAAVDAVGGSYELRGGGASVLRRAFIETFVAVRHAEAVDRLALPAAVIEVEGASDE